MIRAVLDTNVLVSGLISEAGAPARLLDAWADGAFELIVSPRLLEEVERVLRRPKLRKWIGLADGVAFVAAIRAGAVVSIDVERPPRVASDPGDDYLVALAATAGDMLVSGDRRLTTISSPPVPILPPRAFLEELDRGATTP